MQFKLFPLLVHVYIVFRDIKYPVRAMIKMLRGKKLSPTRHFYRVREVHFSVRLYEFSLYYGVSLCQYVLYPVRL